MKRYLIFWFYDYYPSGGWNDLETSVHTTKEAAAYIKENAEDHRFGDWQVIDGTTGESIDWAKHWA